MVNLLVNHGDYWMLGDDNVVQTIINHLIGNGFLAPMKMMILEGSIWYYVGIVRN